LYTSILQLAYPATFWYIFSFIFVKIHNKGRHPMKRQYTSMIISLFLFGLISFAFQCGSPEFTGAKVQENNKNYAEAIRLLEKEVAKNPANAEAWYRLGYLRAEHQSNYEGMNIAFKEASKLTPDYNQQIYAWRYKHWAQYINGGVSMLKRANADSAMYYDRAIEEYNNAVKVWPDTAVTYLYLAAAYKGKGDIENLIAIQLKAWQVGHEKDIYREVGRLYSQKGLEIKDQFNKDNADKLRILKNVNDISTGSFKVDVMRMFGAPDNQKKDKKNPKREEWTYNQYNMLLTVEGERVVTKKMLKPLDLQIDSTKFKLAYAEFDKAVKVFEDIKAMDPRDNVNLNMLLQAYYEANRIPEATKAFKQAVENDPSNKMNHYILGLLHRTIEDYVNAIAEFEAAAKIDPNFGDALFDIGATYYNWGVKLKKESQEKGDESTEYKNKFKEALPWMEKVADIKLTQAKEAAAKSGKNYYEEISISDAKIWDTLGTIYAMTGQSENAGKALDEGDKIRKSGK
jgi:tetratricopeptide (TPR) repeat protein